jgi:hypothetical protein
MESEALQNPKIELNLRCNFSKYCYLERVLRMQVAAWSDAESHYRTHCLSLPFRRSEKLLPFHGGRNILRQRRQVRLLPSCGPALGGFLLGASKELIFSNRPSRCVGAARRSRKLEKLDFGSAGGSVGTQSACCLQPRPPPYTHSRLPVAPPPVVRPRRPARRPRPRWVGPRPARPGTATEAAGVRVTSPSPSHRVLAVVDSDSRRELCGPADSDSARRTRPAPAAQGVTRRPGGARSLSQVPACRTRRQSSNRDRDRRRCHVHAATVTEISESCITQVRVTLRSEPGPGVRRSLALRLTRGPGGCSATVTGRPLGAAAAAAR